MEESIDAQQREVESPPPADQPVRQESEDARARLNRLACELVRTQNRRLLVEFLQLRRSVRR